MVEIIEGAPVCTMANGAQEALAIENGLVAAVGALSELRARFANARRVSIEGSIVPAFNDCHCHILSLGIDLAKADLRGCRSVEEIQARLRDWSARNPAAEWILGLAYDQNLLPGGKHLTRKDLDAVSSERPIYLNHVSKHGAAVNSVALRLAGIGALTEDPSDGKIERDEKGEPTGILMESASSMVSRLMSKPNEDEMVERILAAGKSLADRGILAASDASTGWIDLETELRAYARAGEAGCPVKMTLMPLYGSVLKRGWLGDPSAMRTAFSGARIGPIKLFADGALTLRTAALREPYADGTNRGILNYEPEDLIERIVRAHRAGWQIAVHAIGDRAVDIVLDGYERALESRPVQDHRHRIEHCMMMHPDSMDRMRRLGVMAVAQPEFLHWLGPAYLEGIGERANYLMPYRSWADAGIEFAFSSDQPVVPGDPIAGWRAAVTRRSASGFEFGASERLSPLTALERFTVGGAYATFDSSIGSLAPGMEARFAVLSRTPEQIGDGGMKVLGTSNDLST